MKRLLFSVCICFGLVIPAQAANLASAMVGGQLFYSSDSDNNSVTRVTASDWLVAKNQSPSPYQTALQDWYSQGDISFDLSGGKPVVQVSTRDSGNPAGAFIEFDKQISMKGRSLRFRVKASNWKSLIDFSLVLSSDGTKFANSITLDIKSHIINPTDNEWFEIVAPIGDWVVDGKPKLSTLNALLWKVQDNGKAHVSTEIDDLAVIPNVTPAVSITVDDGLSSATAAKAIMSKYKFRGSICLDETALNTHGFLTQRQVDDFAMAGWDISGHQVMHNFRKSTAKEIVAYVKATSAYLKQHHYKGANVFAYPNGIDDPQVNAAVAKHFQYGMDIDGFSNTLGYVAPYRINRRSYDRYTTLAQMESWIKDAKANNEWLILNFHTVDPDAHTDENIDPDEFEALIRFLKTQNITVAPVTEILKTASPAEPVYLNVTQVKPAVQETANIPREFGVSYAHATYRNPSGSFNSNVISLLENLHRGDYALIGQTGIGSLASHNYFVGDVSGYYFLNPAFAWTAGINGDIVDSPQGLVKNISSSGGQIGFDYDKDSGGLSAAIKQSWYSDSNQRTGWIGKVYVNVPDGFNVYANTDRYHDNVTTPDYFSPGNYARYSLGFGFHKVITKYTLTGNADAGRADIDGIWSPAYSWKLLLEAPLKNNWSTKVALGSATSDSTNYRYTYLSADIEFQF